MNFRRAVYGDTLDSFVGRNSYFTDGLEQVDMGLYKSFKVPYHADSIMIRLDVFNVFNRVTWGFPNNDFASANFGKISSAFYTPRSYQVGLRYLY